MRKVFTKIHLWLSLPFGLVITLLCLTGAILVFETEIMTLARKNIYEIKQIETQTIVIQNLIESVQSTLNEDVEVTGITISSNPAHAYQVNLSKPHRASVYINQYTGEIQGKSERAAFFLFIFRLHRWLLDSPQASTEGGIAWGKSITGISTLMFILILLSGLIVWIPRTAKVLKNRIRIATNKGVTRFWYDLHVSAGFWAFALLLIMAVTAPTWSFTWYRSAFYKLLGADLAQQNNRGSNANLHKASASQTKPERRSHSEFYSSTQSDKTPQNKYASWQKVLNTLSETKPKYHKINIKAQGASLSYNRWGNQRATDNYQFDANTGQITKITAYKHSERSNKLRGWIYSLHVGSWGGWFSKLLTVIAALIGASLPITGYYFWIKRLKQKHNKT
ncbi:MAG: PepSY-associated TM helix domain-containing protein [Bacteroidales bacterium]